MIPKVLASLGGVALFCALVVPAGFCGDSAANANTSAGAEKVQPQHSDPFRESAASFANEDSAQFESDAGFAGKKKSHKPHKPHEPHKPHK